MYPSRDKRGKFLLFWPSVSFQLSILGVVNKFFCKIIQIFERWYGSICAEKFLSHFENLIPIELIRIGNHIEHATETKNTRNEDYSSIRLKNSFTLSRGARYARSLIIWYRECNENENRYSPYRMGVKCIMKIWGTG